MIAKMEIRAISTLTKLALGAMGLGHDQQVLLSQTVGFPKS
jgi:hypothetical protein